MLTRDYDEEVDRLWVAEKVGTAAIDAKGNHIEIVEDGSSKAGAVWVEPPNLDGTPILGMVFSDSHEMFYAALLAVIEALVAKGYKTGTANVPDEGVAKMLKRDLGDLITVAPVGKDVKTGKVGYWQIDVVPSEVVDRLRELA